MTEETPQGQEIKTTEQDSRISLLRPGSLLNFQQVLGSVPFLLFLSLLAVIYIGNTHMAEGNVREINKIDRELKELRWNYMSTKSELMFNSKQSEVERATKEMGLKALRVPPKKIVVSAR